MSGPMKGDRTRAAVLAAALGAGLAGLAALALAGEPSPGKILGRFDERSFLLLVAIVYVLAWAVGGTLARASNVRLLQRFAATTGALAILVVAFELAGAVGLVDWQDVLASSARTTRFRDWKDPKWWRLDPELLHVRPAGLHIRGRAAGDLTYRLAMAGPRRYELDVRYDAHGFRNADRREPAEVVVLGDSFVEGALVAGDEVLTSGLARRLGRSVLNLGTSDYGPQQELIVLRRHGLSGSTRLVLWCFFGGNDLHDATRFERRMQRREAFQAQHAPWRKRSFSRSLLTGLRTLIEPREVLASVWGRERAARVVAPGGEARTLYFGYPGQALDEDALSGLEISKACVREARELCEGAGARLVFVYVPTKFEVYAELCTALEGSEVGSWERSGLSGAWSAWCAANGLAFVDLTPALTLAAERGEWVHFEDDTHWTARGHAVAAAALAVEIVRNQWLLE